MTPTLPPAIARGRPKWDPDPYTFVATEMVKECEYRRCQLSNFAVVALAMNAELGRVTIKQIDIFETVYKLGAIPRKIRDHFGHPARAPDGTIMCLDSLSDHYPGDTNEEAGPWNVNNVNRCAGYGQWVAKITQDPDDIGDGEDNDAIINSPKPSQTAVDVANAYIPIPAKKIVRRRRAGNRAEGEAESNHERGEGRSDSNVSGDRVKGGREGKEREPESEMSDRKRKGRTVSQSDGDDWTPDSKHVVLPLTVALIFLIVMSVKLVCGHWGLAWNVGCLLVALAALSWMWVNHTGD